MSPRCKITGVSSFSKAKRLLLVVMALSLLPAPAFSKEKETASKEEEGPFFQFLATLGGGMVHREGFGAFDLALTGAGKGFYVTAVAPIRFDHNGLRVKDWDELNDYGRIIGEVRYGERGDKYHAAVAPIKAWHLGTGFLVSGYESTIDYEHWRTGLVGSFSWLAAGFDLFMDSVINPSVFGLRLAVRPLFWIDGDGIAGRLEFGFSAVADIFSPKSKTASGLNKAGVPIHETSLLVAGGIDFRYPVVRSKRLEVTPYAAWGRVATGDGAQIGLAIQTAFKWFSFGFLGEWQWLGQGYTANYFDQAYMVDRHTFTTIPKRVALESMTHPRMGMRLGLSLGFDPFVTTWIMLDLDQIGEFNTFGAGLEIKLWEMARVSASLYTRGFTTPPAFVKPERTLGSLTASVRFLEYCEVFASYFRDLTFSTTEVGNWSPSDSFMLGVRVGFQVPIVTEDDQQPEKP